MRRLPLLLWVLAVPAFAEEVDAGIPSVALPEDLQPRFDEAVGLVQADHPAEALALLDALIKYVPSNAQVLTLRCAARVKLGPTHATEAVADCDEAARVTPADAKVRLLLATSQEAANAPDDALETWRALGNAPETPAEDRESARRAAHRLDTTLHAGRHFTFLWDAEVPQKGSLQPQFWLTPRWDRVDPYTAVDLRAGVLQSVTRHAAVGFFVDATPMSMGVAQAPSIDARGTLLWHHAGRLLGGMLGGFDHAEVSLGPVGISFEGMLGADAQLGAVRLALNADVSYDRHFTIDGLPPWHARQLLGFMYGLNNGFSFGLEMENRVSWSGTDFRGMAFYLGPSLSYRGKRVWLAISLMPQIAAVKASNDLSGDPLELNDNERYWLRITLGTVAP